MPNSTHAAARTYREAAALGPYRVLRALQEAAEDAIGTVEPQVLVSEVALAAAALDMWSRRLPASVHQALEAGASLRQIADALGKSEIDAYMLWVAYADQQVALWESEVSRDVPPAAAVGINPRVRDAIRERIHPVTLSGPRFKVGVT